MEKLSKNKHEGIKFSFISILILSFLGLQLYTAKHLRGFWPKFRRLQGAYKLLKPPPKPALWPFIDYPMYSYAKYKGDGIKQYSIFGTLSNSSEVQIIPEDLGINYWIFMYGLKEALRKKDQEDISNFVNLYESRNNKKLSKLRLENHPLLLSNEGVISGQPEIVTEIRVEDLEAKN